MCTSSCQHFSVSSRVGGPPQIQCTPANYLVARNKTCQYQDNGFWNCMHGESLTFPKEKEKLDLRRFVHFCVANSTPLPNGRTDDFN